MLISFLFLNKNICCGYSLEAPRRGASNEYPQHMSSSRNKKNIMWIPPLICSYDPFQHYLDNGRLKMKGSVQWSAVQSQAEFRLYYSMLSSNHNPKQFWNYLLSELPALKVYLFLLKHWTYLRFVMELFIITICSTPCFSNKSNNSRCKKKQQINKWSMK